MFKNIPILFECSRVFSLPMTIFSWLVVFVAAIFDSGNILYGIIALFAICLVHMGANILDDYFDYKSLIKQVNFDKKEYLESTQKTKCRYLVSGVVSEKEFLITAFLYFGLASLAGLFFFIKCGKPVLYYTAAAGMIVILYSFMSKIKLSEVAVALAYGPILYGGVYYVMTKTISWEIFVLAIPTMLMTVVLLYIHTVMDYDFDLKEGHLTVANSFNSQLESLVVLKFLLTAAYLAPILLCIFDISDWQVLLTFLTIPLAVDLYKSMADYSADTDSVPEKKWFHFPMENMKHIEEIHAESFMIRMYQSRNLMMYFSLLLTLGLCLSIF